MGITITRYECADPAIVAEFHFEAGPEGHDEPDVAALEAFALGYLNEKYQHNPTSVGYLGDDGAGVSVIVYQKDVIK